MTTESRSASLHLHHSNTPCPKCGANRTYSGGTRIRKLEQTRVRMRRCPTCNHQFTDHRFAPEPLDSRKSLPKSVGQARAAPPHPPMPSAVTSNYKTRVSAGSTTSNFSDSVTVSAHQRLELDLPSDWSATGLQGFTAFAQNELHRASQSFEQPLHAELAWQRLDPALREYIRARQRFELALSLQWNATFQTLRSSSHALLPPFTDLSVTTTLEPTVPPASRELQRSQNAGKPTRVNPRRPAKHGAKPAATARANGAVVSDANAGATITEKSVTTVQPRAGGDPFEEPEPAQSLETDLEPLLRAERSQWQREKLELTQRLFHVEAEKEVLFGKWTKVKRYLEREKIEGTPRGSQQTISDARNHQRSAGNAKRSPSLAVSPSQAANIERLSSALMANLVRLEGYRIKIKDIPHLTGETGPWRAVITHLLERGAVQREGNGLFIALSLVGRLRRNLPPPKVAPVSTTRDQARRVGIK